MSSSSRPFKAYSNYYDLLYKDKDYLSESLYINQLLKNNGVVKGNLLELGSGTGKHASILTNFGHTVHGIEMSSEMVELVKPTQGFTCEQGDICNLNLGRSFDAVISLFHVVSYQVTNEKLKFLLSGVAEHLKIGGVFIFDVWYSPAVYKQKPEVRIKQMSNEKIEVTRIAQPAIFYNENRVDVNYTIFVKDLKNNHFQSFFETHSMRHFSIPEIEFLAKTYGFEIDGVEEFLTSKTPSDNTWSVCITLKRVS
jgi:SAM-dependent methyltransferase